MSAPATATQRRSWLGLLIPALLVFAVLIALGTWQIERKAWKEGLIAALTERLAAPPAVLPPPATWPRLDPARDEYRRVTFTATFDHGKEALIYAAASAFRPDVSGPGYWIFTPARLPDGGTVIVNRGFVPEARKDAASRAAGQIAGAVEIVGVMRWPDARHWFSPADDPRTICGSRAIRWRSPEPRGLTGGLVRSHRSMSSRNCRHRRVACRSRASSWCGCATSTCNTQ